MGRILERKKKIAKTAGFIALGGGLLIGVAETVSAMSAHFEKVAAEKARAEAEQRATMARLTGTDAPLLKNEGYTVHRQLPEIGASCTGNGTTDGNGYNGGNTAIAYEVSKGKDNGTVCVSHTGAGPLVGIFAVIAPPPPPPPPQAQQEQQVADEKAVIKTLMSNDVAIMARKGFTIDGPSSDNPASAMGSACNNDGTTNHTGFQGWHSTVSYNAHDNLGQNGQVCLEHNKPGAPLGTPSRAQFSQSLRNGHVTR